MKTLRNSIAALMLSVSLGAQAIDFSGVESAAQGYLSPSIGVATGFYGVGGQSLVFGMDPVQYSSTLGYCGLSSYFNSDSLFFAHYSDERVLFVLPWNDLYVYACVQAAGASGHAVLYAIDEYAFYTGSNSQTGKRLAPAAVAGAINPAGADGERLDRATLEAAVKALISERLQGLRQ
ncbi:MAG TPA: hypothetical protein VNN09_04040 [Candidatus Competibacteraceae bacterium]|nr:hypothetical protein [Candidatus Competibacteraceae bacterium]